MYLACYTESSTGIGDFQLGSVHQDIALGLGGGLHGVSWVYHGVLYPMENIGQPVIIYILVTVVNNIWQEITKKIVTVLSTLF